MYDFCYGLGVLAGMLTLASAFLGLAFVAYDWMAEKAATRAERRESRVKDEAAILIGQRMTTDAYWFSENVAVMKAIEAYGRGLQSRDSIESIRFTWRESTKPAPKSVEGA